MNFGNISSNVDVENYTNANKPNVTFFYLGCNFSCGYCHNPQLFQSQEKLDKSSIDAILRKAKSNWIKTICITGGEPTLDKNLPNFIEYLNLKDFNVKLDTNGSNPEMLERLITEDNLVYVAMDIKGTPSQYAEVCGYDDLSNIEKSIDLVRQLSDYEFRTTVVPKFHSHSEIESVGKWLDGSKRYILQQFRPDLAGGCLDSTFTKLNTYDRNELQELADKVKDNFEEVKIKCK